MYRWKESEAQLNHLASELTAAPISFHVHYWGAVPQLMSNPVHKHSFFEVCYVLDGSGSYLEQDCDYPLRKGTLFCSRPDITHQIQTTDGLSLLFVAFEINELKSTEPFVEQFNTLARLAKVCIYDGDDFATSLLWKALLIPRADKNKALPEIVLPIMAHSLLLSFLEVFGDNRLRTQTMPHPSKMLLNCAKLYIRDNISQPLSLRKVSSYLNVSERHLSRLFSVGIHETFSSFLRQERVRQAAHLLRTTDWTIKEIVEATGFGSVHYFTRTFRKIKRITPARFRQYNKLET
jgi:AraC-like DNA-binding protein